MKLKTNFIKCNVAALQVALIFSTAFSFATVDNESLNGKKGNKTISNVLLANPPQGRIAVVADGNFRDSDDIAGTPITLAMLRAMGLESKLVHYSHSCDLVRGNGDPGGAFREVEMQISCDDTASKWGGFSGLTFYNCQVSSEKAAAIAELKDEINASSATNPLWIIEAGEPDIMWEAVNASTRSKRAFVYIVTHHIANDKGDFHTLDQVIRLGVPSANVHRIADQNTLLKKPLRDWYWARDHANSKINWLWDRGFKAQTSAMAYGPIVGSFDCSDAGMIYYWATIGNSGGGDQACSVAKLKTLFLNYVGSTPPPPTSSQTAYSGVISIPGVVQAENYDKGGEGVAYHDLNTGNSGNAYRNDNVDVGNLAGRFFIGWTQAGEWLEYKVDVKSAGTYTVKVTYSAGRNGAKLGASFPDENKTLFTGLSLPPDNTGLNYNKYNTTTKSGVSLSKGNHTLRLTIENQGFNIDKVEFILSSSAAKIGEDIVVGQGAQSDLIVYPNPSESGIFTLNKSVKWEVFSLQGDIIARGEDEKIDISNHKKGTYILTTESFKTKIIFE